ncbi:hypothetical protein SKAU_G00195690 [Synaphobranchus kaupii]|uniref:Integrase catalytic domain-containing protein n=1 Tax=Synaphobranchus kaupii TaxID=118154 RepID=A0A9Q1FEG4_SYNKA|nr:hypothetical protein SKAU_G00195690 [Synaphobranchus kaupii]
METDHKPLLSLLGSQPLDALPPRILRFRMRLMHYSYSIAHVPGKCLWTADTLSRAPMKKRETPDEKELFEDTNIYVDMIMENLPASTAYLDELREQLKWDNVIHHLKPIFARHGILETLVTDNRPQFSGMAFAAFAESYGFRHVTSSPKYPQSNGEAEHAVKTVKGLLKKAADPYIALLAYRATPLQNGYSPAQLLMGRRLCTTVPMLPALLTPALPDGEVVVLKEKEKKMRDAQRYNLRHRARSLDRLTPGKEVWVTDQGATGVVVSSHPTPRSYIVDGPHGTVRRNRRHLIPMESSPEQSGGGAAEQPLGYAPGQSSAEPPKQITEPTSTPRTRSGRVVVRPTRLDL